mmetsp:Transcript_77798/g.252098  ORF Transcript_77798/g.252098 Transcript_77798/m.252098 type:complete len:331 (+) Transcript_77798:2022-3014(+)
MSGVSRGGRPIAQHQIRRNALQENDEDGDGKKHTPQSTVQQRACNLRWNRQLRHPPTQRRDLRHATLAEPGNEGSHPAQPPRGSPQTGGGSRCQSLPPWPFRASASVEKPKKGTLQGGGNRHRTWIPAARQSKHRRRGPGLRLHRPRPASKCRHDIVCGEECCLRSFVSNLCDRLIQKIIARWRRAVHVPDTAGTTGGAPNLWLRRQRRPHAVRSDRVAPTASDTVCGTGCLTGSTSRAKACVARSTFCHRIRGGLATLCLCGMCALCWRFCAAERPQGIQLALLDTRLHALDFVELRALHRAMPGLEAEPTTPVRAIPHLVGHVQADHT